MPPGYTYAQGAHISSNTANQGDSYIHRDMAGKWLKKLGS